MKLPLLPSIALLCLGLHGTASAQLAGPAPRPVAPGRVACVGDSITEGAGTQDGQNYPKQLADLLGKRWTVENFGASGHTLLRKGDVPYWNNKKLQDAQAFAPKAVVIMLGTNDTKPQNWPHKGDFVADYRDLVKIFQKLPSHPRVYVCRPCPVPEPGNYGINETNLKEQIPLIDQVARETNAEIIDIHAALAPHPEMLPDRVHPDNAGAAVMARTVYQALTGRPAPSPTPAR